MFKELQDMGLSEKEARVYLSALELGPTTAEKLSKHSKVNRSTTYVQIESLLKMGLMSTYEEDKKTFFAPESPELLVRLLNKQRDSIASRERDLTAILPALMRQFEGAGERPIVRFFPGKEGVTSAREEVLTTKEKQIFITLSYEHLARIYSEKELDEYSDRRKELGIHSKGIYLHREYFTRAGLDNLTERRFLPPSVLPLTIDINVYDDKTAIFSLEGSLFAMIVQSTQIANSMKMIFNVLWEKAEGPIDE
jgi:sugar-specific transcriptional regulator TrmB